MAGLMTQVTHPLLLGLGLVGAAALVYPQVLANARGSRRSPPSTQPATARDTSTWRALAVTSSVAAAGVHAAVFPHHFAESFVVGEFFLLVSLGQAVWAWLVTLGAGSDRLLGAGIVGNLGLVALWTVSRTTGMPFGLGREPVGAWDVASDVWELVVVAACLVGLRHPRDQRELVLGRLGRAAWAWTAGSGAVLLALALTVPAM